ncbi:DUF4974 domain-containing protein [Chitinophaga sp. Mgbs1]|uniref:DUF4974 domain-containing protein n=1 Tax=Chitinophaga solisilvae TaxID=1233460 RepID=A0A3S1B3I6_9BACT|nr:DUF4974 domain-containing protein [Chitinophaga solisilvae]
MGQQLPERPPQWLLLKYKNGNCTPAETRRIDTWFESTDGAASLEEDADLQAIHHQVMEHIGTAASRRLKRLRLYAAAAAGLLLLFTTFLMRMKPGRPALSAGWTVIQTSPGELKKITLPDNSSVVLNSCSRLRYRNGFARQREVQLQGEAFFDITADAAHPFSVQSDSLRILVLGTRFNIAAYPDDSTATVVLESGSVKVNSIRLQPGEVLHRTAAGITVQQADLESAFAWQQGMLLYKDVPLAAICKDLERRYGVPIRITGKPLQAATYYYSSRRIPLPQVLKVLSESGSGFYYQINSKEIVISAQKIVK